MALALMRTLAFISWATSKEAEILSLLLGTLGVFFVYKILHTFATDHSFVRVIGVIVVGSVALVAASNPQWFVGQANNELKKNGGLAPINAKPAPAALAARNSVAKGW